MAIFRKKKTRIYMAMQAEQGSPAAITAAHAVRVTGDSTFVQPKGDQIDRGLIADSDYPSEVVAGGRWGEGPITVELKGSGTPGTPPEYAPALETLLGSMLINSASTVGAGTGALDGFGSAEELTVGQLARVDVSAAADGTTFEVRRISSVSGAGPYVYTVQRDFSAIPQDGAVISAGISFFKEPDTEPKYYTHDQYLEKLRIYCPDAACESINVGVGEREVIRAVLGIRSLTCAPTGSAIDPNTPVFDISQPLLGTECNLILGGELKEMKNLEFSLSTRRARGGINSAGFSALPWSAFEATATMAPWVEDAAEFVDFFAGSLANAELTKGTVAGNILHIELAGLQHNGPDIGEDEGDYVWNSPKTITQGVYIGLF